MIEGDEQVLLVKPETFMNLSGRAVRPGAWTSTSSTSADLLVVCDDINLPLGKLRVRAKGSHGGQNGLRNIQEQLGTQEYARLRIGIDAPGEHLDAADHVLSRFKPGERPVVEEAIATAAQAVLVWVRDGIDVCMNRFNGDPKPEKPKKEKAEEAKGPPRRPRSRRRQPKHPNPENEPAMPVNSYECLFLLDPTKTSTDMDGVKTQLHGTLEKYGAEILASRKWDDRKLAYPIGGHKKGIYHLTYFKVDRQEGVRKSSTISGSTKRSSGTWSRHIDPKWEEEMLAVARDDHRMALQSDARGVARGRAGAVARPSDCRARRAIRRAEGGDGRGRRGPRRSPEAESARSDRISDLLTLASPVDRCIIGGA